VFAEDFFAKPCSKAPNLLLRPSARDAVRPTLFMGQIKETTLTDPSIKNIMACQETLFG